MIEFAYPWCFALLGLPPIVYFLAPVYKEQRDSLQVPFFNRLVNVSGEVPRKGAVKLNRRLIQRFFLVVGWICLVIAMAKPEWIGEPIEQKKSAREIMIALDLSGSMSEEDFISANGENITRLDAAKQVLRDFAIERQHDRLGLILFGDAAYLQAPFTEDIQTWLTLLEETELGVAGWQTAFGDAIGLSITAFENEDTKNRVLILLTDGYDTGSKMPPLKAAEVAQRYNIKIYTIAMGDPQTQGQYKLDLETLERIADITGGASFEAINREQLQAVYLQINQMEQQLYNTLSFRPRTSLHFVPFAIYLVTNLLVIMIATVLRRQREVTVDTTGPEQKTDEVDHTHA